LGAADGAAHHLRLDGQIIRNIAPAHESLSRPGVEQAHEVIRQRQVEPALAGVTLASGATAQLVVDAAGLVALSTEHVEATDLDDLVGLHLDLGRDPLEYRVPLLLVL